MTEILIFALVFGGFFYIIKSINNAAGTSLGKKKKCPFCHNNGMKPGKFGGYYRNGIRVSDWECPHCGRSFTN